MVPSGKTFKVELVRCTDGLDVSRERKRKVRVDSLDFSLSYDRLPS